jgi:hypothetical protein
MKRLSFLLFLVAACARVGDSDGSFPLEEAHPEHSMLARWAQKEVLDTRLVDDMEEEGRWTVREGTPELSYTRERCIDGVQALRQRVSLVDLDHLQDPAERTAWDSFDGEQGGSTCVALTFDEPQDWSAYNRISLWVYIHPSKNPNVSFALDLVTDTPDSTLTHSRETNVDIPQGAWTQVLWEIDDLPRDKIRRFEIIQTCTGYDRAIGEPDVSIDFDRLELQRVVPDHYEGWDLPEGHFAFAHTGYRPDDSKVALAGPGDAESFDVVTEAEEVVFKGNAGWVHGRGNAFRRLDFSGFRKPGTYRIRYGDAVSEPFPIGPDVWKEPLRGALNFYFCQRCGYPVPGIHDVCHQDIQGFCGEEKVVVNGGWHDAGDLSQGFWRTAYGCYALLDMLEAVQGDKRLRKQVAEEARWGVDWLMKVRFSEGRHISWTKLRYYSDNEIGKPDDVVSQAAFVPWEVFQGVTVFLKAAQALKLTADERARLEAAARADWEAAMATGWTTADYLTASWGAMASAALYERFKDDKYRAAALQFGELLTQCQETGSIDGMSLTGFFYTDPSRRQILHDRHAAFNEAPMLAYAALSAAFPKASAPFREGARLYLDRYLKPGSEIAAPYHLLPAGLFTKAETAAQPGTPVSGQYVLRTFPVWSDHIFHGATNFHLSQAWALAAAARLLDDTEALALVQEQLEWVLGRNPFSSSLMYGVGYNYAPDFAYCTHNIVGALPVGVDCFHDDAPFWNGSASACSHEIWIEPVSRFLGTLAVFLKR